ncbi:MAG TPA: BrnT family toxin [Xanthobacteraceae bacterium]|nr:BrnT family toxin [Xanthobacteraceae bacterium]
MRIEFDWDQAKAASNIAKHGIAFEEAMAVFRDPLARTILDPDHAPGEERWVTLGEVSSGNLLVVVHTWQDIDRDRSLVRIISARRPTRNEARRYREEP